MQKQGRVCDLGMPLKRTNLVLILDFNHSFKLLSFGKNLESDPTLVFDPSLVCALYILNIIMKSQCMTVMPGTLKMAYLKYMLYFTVKKKKKKVHAVFLQLTCLQSLLTFPYSLDFLIILAWSSETVPFLEQNFPRIACKASAVQSSQLSDTKIEVCICKEIKNVTI